MYVLCKSTGKYSDTSWEIVGYSNDKNVLELVKTKFDLAQQELDELENDYRCKDSFDAKYPNKRNTCKAEQYTNEVIEYNKKLIADNPKYLPFVSYEHIIIDNRNAFYYIDEVKELFA